MGLVGGVFQAQSATNSLLPEFSIPVWEQSVSLRSGFGYKDNVKLSGTDRQGSAFWEIGVDGVAFHLPTKGWVFSAFASANDTAYLDHSTGVNNEKFAVLAVQLTKDFGGWRLGGGLNYTYQDQVFDVSNLETNNYGIGTVRGHTLGERFSGRKDFGPWWGEVELSLARQWLAAPLDSSWQSGPRATLGRAIGNGSELTLSYRWNYLLFDNRQEIDAAGLPLDGTHLRFNEHVGEVAWHQFWDLRRRWETTVRLGMAFNRDNGSGYFDYDETHLAGQIKWHAVPWELSLQLRASNYEFPNQTVSDADNRMRRRTPLTAGFRLERHLYKKAKIYAEYSFEYSYGKAASDHYRANTVSGGLEWEF